MKNFKSTQLALAIALAGGVLTGCNNTSERASTENREDQKIVSMKKDSDIENRSADKAAVVPRGDTTTEDQDEYSLREDYRTETTEQQSVTYKQNRNQQQRNTQIEGNETVTFEFDSVDLTDNAKKSLDKLVNTIEDQKDSIGEVTIEGYADATGPDAYNDQLSQRRAESVKNYLQDKGIEAKSWNVEGKGEENPVASNDSERGRKENRRVEIELSGQNREGYTSSYNPD